MMRWLRRLRRLRVTTARPGPQTTPVVIACPRCDFKYDVLVIPFEGGRMGAFWFCDCGVKYVPPGGSFEAQRLVTR